MLIMAVLSTMIINTEEGTLRENSLLESEIPLSKKHVYQLFNPSSLHIL
jgi:hypothetical protein